jgi:uncharacterized transporter YbjL
VLSELLGNPLLALFVVVAVGLLIGRVELWGLSLGGSGVLFAGMVLGYMGYGIPAGVGTLGLVLFVYCVGISAGPRFFRAFVREGKALRSSGCSSSSSVPPPRWRSPIWPASPSISPRASSPAP